jgi:hypothetical protein
MPTHADLIRAIAAIGSDYQPRPLTAADVERWIDQFPRDVQEPILGEIRHVLERTYLAESVFDTFLRNVITQGAGSDPASYWRGVRFLRLQQAGNSQKVLLRKFDSILRQTYGLAIDKCGYPASRYLYLDDVLFSGGRIKSDLATWIHSDAPTNAELDVLVVIRHTQGSYFTEGHLANAAKSACKNIALRFPHSHIIEDRKARTNVSDVFRPASVPADPRVRAYVDKLGVEPLLRSPGSVGGHAFFSSEAGRNLLEQEFLKAGVRVHDLCPRLPKHLRPLGCTVQRMLGFGSTIVTYRNCPNNAPIALWAGDPWYPLFPRETN